MEHSPLPWSKDDDGDFSEILDGNHLTIGEIYSNMKDTDAALIVRAVNNHDALVAALEELIDVFALTDESKCQSQAIKEARAALTKAKP